MMRTIAIDTSHAAGTVAALAGPSVATRTLGVAGEHASRIATALDEATGELGWRLANTELVVVVRGPGSFTGLRVGVAAAKSIAWASQSKLVGVDGFQVIAHEAAGHMDAAASIHIAFDAGRGEVYAAIATAAENSSGWQVSPACLMKADGWIDALPPCAVVSGPSMQFLADRVAEAGHTVAPPKTWYPNATAAATIGLARAADGDIDDIATFLPHYMRLSYADESRPTR